MQPLNPFLRAFFASKLPPQCYPSEQYVLLVPATEYLLSNKDQETQTPYTELVHNEEFLASHVLRINNNNSSSGPKDAVPLRESKGKARQYTTLDGRTLVIKDILVYTNKGFKNLTQAQLLQDEVYYTNTFDASQWLIYYISRPLLGTPEPLVPLPSPATPLPPLLDTTSSAGPSGVTYNPKQGNIKVFSELLNQFPMIARQMQPGLENLFQQFRKDMEKPLPDLPPLSPSSPSADGSAMHAATSNSVQSPTSTVILSASSKSDPSRLTADMDVARNAAETMVTSAIDLFHNVDKQQLSILAAATNLSGPVLERMIERYVMEQVHDRLLFPQICAANIEEDERLERCKAQMSCVDVSQIGLTEDEGLPSKRLLARRVVAGVEAFKKMGVTGSPEEMLQILLDTEKRVTFSSEEDQKTFGGQHDDDGVTAAFTTNADTLVSMLLVVIIRSPIRHLHARLAYMRDFSFVEDVESGEIGYALSTYEAVLAYISHNSRGLRKISRSNRALWTAVRKGDLQIVRSSLGLSDSAVDSGDNPDDSAVAGVVDDSGDERVRFQETNGHAHHKPLEHCNEIDDSHLTHVYPWQRRPTPDIDAQAVKIKKRVSMDTRSLSSSSIRSALSRISTSGSIRSIVSGEIRPEQLCRTEDAEGNSILMMAVENSRHLVLEFLLSLDDMFPPKVVFHDHNNDGTTLLSAAVQGGNAKVLQLVLKYMQSRAATFQDLVDYLAFQDSKGRSAAHYLFNAPYLIEPLGPFIPWKLKDKNGQTPLFAIFRSYDHESYQELVESAMMSATKYQGNSGRLCLDDHVDGKGNSLLHVIHDPRLIRQLLYQCKSDPNSVNDRRFTPLMVASKFGRVDLVRILFGDERVDLQARDLRGLTAVELAKDDDVRNRIDDMLLLSGLPPAESRKTMIVRSFFVDDGSLRLVIKSGARNPNATITVTTCRRSLVDFENLSKWLALEHPASWVPSILRLRTPFQIPSKPSRHILRDIQLRVDNFLQTLLAHPTFSTHEMLWEFILVPDIDTNMLGDRARRKALARADKLQEEYAPLLDGIPDVELFITHARDQVFNVHQSYRSLLRQVAAVRIASNDLAEANRHAAKHLAQLPFIDDKHITAMNRYVGSLGQTEYSPTTRFYYYLTSILSNTSAILHSLARPSSITRSIDTSRDNLAKFKTSASRSNRWPSPFGLLDESRSSRERDNLVRAATETQELRRLGSELRYTQQTVATELAGFQEGHAKAAKMAVREWARKMVIVERNRLECMKRALREIGKGVT